MWLHLSQILHFKMCNGFVVNVNNNYIVEFLIVLCIASNLIYSFMGLYCMVYKLEQSVRASKNLLVSGLHYLMIFCFSLYISHVFLLPHVFPITKDLTIINEILSMYISVFQDCHTIATVHCAL